PAGQEDQQARSEHHEDEAPHRPQSRARTSVPGATATGDEPRTDLRHPTIATTARMSPSAPTTMPAIPRVLAVLASSRASLLVAAMPSFRRGISRSNRAASSVPVGTFVGNSTSAGSARSSNVVGPEVNRSSTFCFPIDPTKWNVYVPGEVGMIHAR